MSENFAHRVQAYREREGISQDELAARLGISRNYVSMIEGGKKEASQQLQRSFEMLELSPISKGSVQYQAQRQIQSNAVREDAPMRRIPIISLAQAGELIEWDDVYDHCTEAFEVRDPKAIAFEIRGDSMEPRYPSGTVAIVYPSQQAQSDNLVVARLTDGSVLFKRLHITGEDYHFLSINPAYPPIVKKKQEIERILPVAQTVRYEL